MKIYLNLLNLLSLNFAVSFDFTSPILLGSHWQLRHGAVFDDSYTRLGKSSWWLMHLSFDLIEVILVSVKLINFLLSFFFLVLLNILNHTVVLISLLFFLSILNCLFFLNLLILKHLRLHFFLFLCHLSHSLLLIGRTLRWIECVVSGYSFAILFEFVLQREILNNLRNISLLFLVIFM